MQLGLDLTHRDSIQRDFPSPGRARYRQDRKRFDVLRKRIRIKLRSARGSRERDRSLKQTTAGEQIYFSFPVTT